MLVTTASLVLLLLGTAAAVPGKKGEGSKGPKDKGPAKPAAGSSGIKVPANARKIGDIFEIVSGSKPDSCDQYYDPKAAPGQGKKILNVWWDQVNTFAAAGKAAVGAKYDDYEKRKLVEAFFAIKAGDSKVKKAKVPAGKEGEALEQVKNWHDHMVQYITSSKDKPLLACGSAFVQWQKPTNFFKDAGGRDSKIKLLNAVEKAGYQRSDIWVWWNDIDKVYNVQERSSNDKCLTDLNTQPGAAAGKNWKPSSLIFCDIYHAEAVTFPASPSDEEISSDWDKRAHRKRPVMIICPWSFLLNSPATPIPLVRHQLDTQKHAVGTELLSMETSAVTLYHEMFHLVFERENDLGQSIDTQDQLRLGAKTDGAGRIVADFSLKDSGWETRKEPGIGPVQMMYNAFFCKVVKAYDVVENPESYACFGLTNALHDIDGMDWSSGIAQQVGGAFKGPWTDQNRHTKDKLVPIDTTGQDEVLSDEDEADEQEGSVGVQSGDEGDVGPA